jgi:hypothetical protein
VTEPVLAPYPNLKIDREMIDRLRKLSADLRADDLDMKLPPGSIDPDDVADALEAIVSPKLARTDTEADLKPGERLWTVKALIDAWEIYTCVIAAPDAETAKEIMDETNATWGTPSYDAFDHTEYEVVDDKGDVVLEQGR